MLKSVILSVVMRRLLILLLGLLLAGGLLAQKHKKKPDEEPKPQVLDALPETPEAVVAESGRLSFQVSPLSDKGLLSQQVRDALKALARLNHGAAIVKVHAFHNAALDVERRDRRVLVQHAARREESRAQRAHQLAVLDLMIVRAKDAGRHVGMKEAFARTRLRA